MFETITRLIDSDPLLLDEFIQLAEGYKGSHVPVSDLAEAIKIWFEENIEFLTIATDFHIYPGYKQSIEHLFLSTLKASIQNIGYVEWRDIANHYLNKANDLR